MALGSVLQHHRVIAAVAGNTITVDAPIPEPFDAAYVRPPGARIVRYTFPVRIAKVGVEGLHALAPPMVTAINLPTFKLMNMNAVINGWEQIDYNVIR